MTALPAEALKAALATGALKDPFLSDRTRVKILLEAAAPHIAAAERDRCAQLVWNEAVRCAGTITGRALADASNLLREER